MLNKISQSVCSPDSPGGWFLRVIKIGFPPSCLLLLLVIIVVVIVVIIIIRHHLLSGWALSYILATSDNNRFNEQL